MGRLPGRRLHGRLRVEALKLRHPAAPVAAVAAIAAAWLAVAPPVADLAAHHYRAWLWRSEGFAVWNAQWYGGHHVPAYSLVFPPLAALLGAAAATAAAGVAAAAALVALVRERPAAAWLLAAAAAANLVAGRGPFTLGVAFAALALAHRGRLPLAIALGLLTAAASPVAALFLCMIGVGLRAPALVVPPAGLVALLALLFPEGGAERFVATAFWPVLALTVAAAALLPGRWRVVAGLYALLLVGAFALETPLGQNAARFGALAGPAALAVAGRGPRPAIVLVGAGLLYLQLLPAVRAVVEAHGDPAAQAAFHRPLLRFLDGAAAPGERVEIPFTRNHWEAAHVAPHWPLARGWERQLDVERNRLFYDGELTPQRYERWLRAERIRWVALPDAPLDFSARQEAALLRSGQPFLQERPPAGGWRVWELIDAPPPATGPGRVLSQAPQRVELELERPGRLLLAMRHTRYWRIAVGRGTVREQDGRLAIDAVSRGRLVVEAALRRR